RFLSKELPVGLESAMHDYIASLLSNPVKLATRKASQMALEFLCKNMPEMFGGSAYLTGSNNTKWSGSVWINKTQEGANYLYY
ncbi:transketolase, partial [Francisella tularensis subsp. holarctica]|nr:transketolase [Francisella tularensis subsp. holarctica]